MKDMESLRGTRQISETLRQDMIQAINSGKYLPGTRLPTMRELGKQYGIAHVVAAAALEPLVRDGYIIKRQGMGTFVTPNYASESRAIRYHSIYPLPPFMQAAFARFKKKRPDVTVIQVDQEYEADLLFFGTTGVNELIRSHSLLELDPLMEVSSIPRDFFASVPLSVGVHAGKVWSLPIFFEPHILNVNRALLDKDSERLLGRWDLDEFREVVRRTHARHKGQVRALNSSCSFFSQIMPFFSQFGARLVDAEGLGCHLDDERALAAFTYCRDLIAAMPGFSMRENSRPADFYSGKLAIYQGPCRVFMQGKKHFGADSQGVPLPPGRFPGGCMSGCWAAIHRHVHCPEIVWGLLKFLVSLDEQRRLLQAGVMFPSARSQVLRILRQGRYSLNGVAQAMAIPENSLPPIPSSDLFYLDRSLDHWWDTDELPQLLSRTKELLDARLNTLPPPEQGEYTF